MEKAKAKIWYNFNILMVVTVVSAVIDVYSNGTTPTAAIDSMQPVLAALFMVCVFIHWDLWRLEGEQK